MRGEGGEGNLVVGEITTEVEKIEENCGEGGLEVYKVIRV